MDSDISVYFDNLEFKMNNNFRTRRGVIMPLTDKERLDILLEIFDKDIEDTLVQMGGYKHLIEGLDEVNLEKVVFIFIPSLRTCPVDCQKLKELIAERIKFVLSQNKRIQPESAVPSAGDN